MRTILKSAVSLCVISLAFQAEATTVQVGSCLAHLQSYVTISEAVGAVPAGSTVWVCPGLYPEQVTVAKSLTLHGALVGNTAGATITVPSGGLKRSVLLRNNVAMYFQILVQGSPSDVITIRDLGINGLGHQVGTKGWMCGICYRATSGSISHTAVYNQKGNGSGFGIFLEGGGPPDLNAISIIANSIHDFDDGGIRSNANSNPPSLSVSIRENSVVISRSPTLYDSAAAISIDGTGEISGNRLLGPSMGIGIGVLSNLKLSNNTIEGFGIGIWLVGQSNTIVSNRISSTTGAGIILSGNGNAVERNYFLNAANAISFNETGTSNHVVNNTINDSGLGVGSDPGGNVVSPNQFSNVSTIKESQ